MIPEPEDVKRWTARRKAALVLDIIKGKTTTAEVARSHDLTVDEVEQWLIHLCRAANSPRNDGNCRKLKMSKARRVVKWFRFEAFKASNPKKIEGPAYHITQLYRPLAGH